MAYGTRSICVGLCQKAAANGCAVSASVHAFLSAPLVCRLSKLVSQKLTISSASGSLLRIGTFHELRLLPALKALGRLHTYLSVTRVHFQCFLGDNCFDDQTVVRTLQSVFLFHRRYCVSFCYSNRDGECRVLPLQLGSRIVVESPKKELKKN